jgi:uncharacterized protein YjbI with pentapeptide repeats
MANEDHLKVLLRGSATWNQWRQASPEIQPDLSDANLSEADLIGVNFSGADLTGAILSRADLSGAKLRKTNLTWAILYDAILSNTILTRCLNCAKHGAPN